MSHPTSPHPIQRPTPPPPSYQVGVMKDQAGSAYDGTLAAPGEFVGDYRNGMFTKKWDKVRESPVPHPGPVPTLNILPTRWCK